MNVHASNEENIDIVIPWVDGSDEKWRDLKSQYEKGNTLNRSNESNKDSRYRDWDILKYLFRSIEKYAPWVSKIHFVTCGQKPQWLNIAHPKLNLVNHGDYIPSEYLPTFSSHTIELNFFRIKELSERFIYFNDDFFLTAPTVPTDFFKNGLPCDAAILTPIYGTIPGHPFVHYLLNNIQVVNGHFDLRDVQRAKPWNWFNVKYGKYNINNIMYSLRKRKLAGLYNFHMPASMLKSTFQRVWEMEPEILDATCRNRFRGLNDVNQYVMSYMNLCENKFVPRSPKWGKYFSVGERHEELYDSVINQRYKYIAINDTDYDIDFEKERDFLVDMFETVFPVRSAFEIE